MKNALWVIIAVIVIGGGVYWWMSSNSTSMTDTNTAVNENATSPAPVTETPAPADTTGAATPAAAPTTITVTYDGKTFSPATVTAKVGDTVMFKNSSGKNMWIASDEHPTHTEYDGSSRSTHCAAGYTGATPFDQCKPGTDYSFTFTKAGTHDFHDHLNPGAHGTVTVQ
jgi:plastocyanin